MQKKTLKEFMDKQTPSAWVWAVEQAINETMVEIRNLKQQVDKLMKWKEFEDRERRNHLLNAKDIDRKWQCGKCDQQKAKEEGKLFREFVEFPDHFRTCEKRKKGCTCEQFRQEEDCHHIGDEILKEVGLLDQEEEKPRWRPQHNEKYYYLSDGLETCLDFWDSSGICISRILRFEAGNFFRTEAQALHAASEVKKLLKSLQQ